MQVYKSAVSILPISIVFTDVKVQNLSLFMNPQSTNGYVEQYTPSIVSSSLNEGFPSKLN